MTSEEYFRNAIDVLKFVATFQNQTCETCEWEQNSLRHQLQHAAMDYQRIISIDITVNRNIVK